MYFKIATKKSKKVTLKVTQILCGIELFLEKNKLNKILAITPTKIKITA